MTRRRPRILSIGLGPIGLAATELVLARESLELAGAVDLDPAKAGRDLGELVARGEPLGLEVEDDAEAALDRLQPDAVLLCTGSTLPAVEGELLAAARRGVDVVSSCEEMLVPDLAQPELAGRIHRAALAGGATLVGTGVNPGFVLDFLPVVASALCRRVDRVWGRRVLDAARRREPLQRKVGAGLSVDEFRRRAAAGELGHVGMRESVALVARALDLGIDPPEQSVEPVVAGSAVASEHVEVAAGRVAGIRNVGVGRRNGEAVVELELEMYLGAAAPRDELELAGDPPLRLVLEGGVPGDAATVAVLVNYVPRVAAAAPGLVTVLDLLPPRAGR